MERFIQQAGKALAQARSGINFILEEKIQSRRTYLMFFILSVFILFILGVSLIFSFKSLTEHYLIFLVLLIAMVITILWVAIFYESDKHLESDRHNFKMENFKKARINYKLINLEEDSKKDFDKLLSGRNVRNRINFTMGNKSGDSANHRIIFILFDELILGGIKDLTGERKKDFFQLLMNSFLMNGEPVKENTLKTSFSAWKNEQEKIGSRNQRILIKQLLGKE